MNEDAKYLKEVREQYEKFPYPKRNPENEKQSLLIKVLDKLELINHYCFKGDMKLNPKGKGEKLRFFVAGGGTGDSAIYLAEALREFNADIVYLDMSTTSMAVAKERATIRKLENIHWIHGSILEIPNLDLGVFDYINCTGVLHHLENPTEGLQILKTILKPDGAMGIMVYGLYGRTGIYQVQELMRIINKDEQNLQVKVDNTKTSLKLLPTTNWYKRDEARWKIDVDEFADIGIYDLFLHSQDRAYSVPQLYQWIESEAGLKIVEFIGEGLEGKMGYRPETFIKDKQLLEKVSKLSIKDKQAIAELMSGMISKHSLYVTNNHSNKDATASVDDLNLIPYFNPILIDSNAFANTIKDNPNQVINYRLNNINYKFQTTPLSEKIIRRINGKRTIKDVLKNIAKGKNAAVNDEFNRIFNFFSSFDAILLKSKRFPSIKNDQELQQRVTDLYT